jgi:hypothetical protein
MSTTNQGQNDVPHITYYDEALDLSFVWDNTRSYEVAVSHGGYGEAVIDTFSLSDNIFHDPHPLDRFANECRIYTRGWRARGHR